ncbi:hypothetical protein [Deinococcus apachensis]|uniref:hypothetical protein n=1 Tax=Deinococcus apachensis TaxID=309886 RepID=UPI0003603580|nr:hypothetical protein [Deinococcus apachensis]
MDALLQDTGPPFATEPILASPLLRGLERGLTETAPKPSPRADENPFARYRDDPVGFARDVLGLTVWAAMEHILLAVRDKRKVAVRSGHKVSKSTTAAVIALWRCLCQEGSRTVLSAPTARQVKIIIWKELTARRRAAWLPGDLLVDPGTGFHYRDSEVLGFATNEPEKIAGVSGVDLLFIIDEASGVDEALFEAIEGNMASGASLFLISNPTQVSGTFYDAFTTKRHLRETIHISSEDTPNVISGEILIPGLATRDWVMEKRQEWGEDSPLYQVRVRGNFPTQSENTVIGLTLVEAARLRYDADDAPITGAFDLGVDVARFGDDSTVLQPILRARKRALPPRVHAKQDNVEVAGHVMDLVQELRETLDYPVSEGPVHVKIDDTGNGGGVTDHLRHSERAAALGIVVIPVTVGVPATTEGYSNLRAQIWFASRDWLKEGGQLPPDGKMEGEAVAVKYSFDTQGRAKVERKEDIKKHLGRSSDRWDALGWAFMTRPSRTARTVQRRLRPASRCSPARTRKGMSTTTYILGPDGQPVSSPREDSTPATAQLRGASLPANPTILDATGSTAPGLRGGWTYADGAGRPLRTGRYGMNRDAERLRCPSMYFLNPLFQAALRIATSFLIGDAFTYGEVQDKTARLGLEEFWQANNLGTLMSERWLTEVFLDGENATVFPQGDANPGPDAPARIAFLDLESGVRVESDTALGTTAADMVTALYLRQGVRERTWERGQFVWTAEGALWNDPRGLPFASGAVDAAMAYIQLANHRLNIHEVQQRIIGIYTAMLNPSEPDGGEAKWRAKAAAFRFIPSKGAVIPLITKPGHVDKEGNRYDGVTEKLEFPKPASGASDAKEDMGVFLRLVGLCLGGLPEHWLGEGGEVTRTAADNMSLPAVRLGQLRQATVRSYLDRLGRTELARRWPGRLYTVYITRI